MRTFLAWMVPTSKQRFDARPQAGVSERNRRLRRHLARRRRPPAPKIDKHRQGLVDFPYSLFTLHFFFSTGGELSKVKTLIYDLLVLLCRSAIRAGADQEKTMAANHRYYQEINQIQDFDRLCQWMTQVVNTTMDSIFDFGNVRHAGLVHRSVQYIHANYAQHLTLESIAQQVYLSPTYFGRIFKEGTGESFTAYLTRVRIQRSKELLRYESFRLTDIAQLVGVEDQSYFSRVFKRMEGVSPRRYRELNSKKGAEKNRPSAP